MNARLSSHLSNETIYNTLSDISSSSYVGDVHGMDYHNAVNEAAVAHTAWLIPGGLL